MRAALCASATTRTSTGPSAPGCVRGRWRARFPAWSLRPRSSTTPTSGSWQPSGGVPAESCRAEPPPEWAFDPGIRVDDVTVTGRRTAAHPGFRVVEDSPDPRYIRIRGPLRFSAPSLTVIDLLRDGDDDPLYDALRRRVVSLHSVRRALSAHPQRAGNAEVRRLLWRARENAWSRGEAELHDFLRRLAIAGWNGNVRREMRGSVHYIDALFGRERLALELDGVEHHSSTIDREYDYRRRALLMAHGYRVLGLTLGMLRTDPERVAWEIVAARAITRPPDPGRPESRGAMAAESSAVTGRFAARVTPRRTRPPARPTPGARRRRWGPMPGSCPSARRRWIAIRRTAS